LLNLPPEVCRSGSIGHVEELIAWLREQLDADGRVAQRLLEASPGTSFEPEVTDPEVLRSYLDRWSPARVLAEVANKRQHIARWEWANSLVRPDHIPAIRDEIYFLRLGHTQVILDDAQPYSGQAGWKDEWLTLREA
jgi:hypothetical protein